MQILISCAKTMGQAAHAPSAITLPAFLPEAERAARCLMTLDAATLGGMLRVNASLAAANARRYAAFFDDSTPVVPALWAYTGIVFQQIDAASLSRADVAWAQQHLFITSFLYGLLRPCDGIRPYRLEGDAQLPCDDGLNRFKHWQPLLTDHLIAAAKADDGVVVNLASSEMKRLFDWRRVCREVHVVTPDFRTIDGDRERSVVVYTKMSRGQMTRHLIQQRATDTSHLADFMPDIEGAAVVTRLM